MCAPSCAPPCGRATGCGARSTSRVVDRDAFDADDAQLVGIVADQVSAALRSARLLDGLKKA